MLSEDETNRLFVVHFQSELISCDSPDDAIAITTANDILRGRIEREFTPEKLNRLAGVLIRYGRDAEAETLSHFSSEQRAAQLFSTPLSYRRAAQHIER